MCLSGAHYTIEDHMVEYEVGYWILEFHGEEDMGYDFKWLTVEASSEEEALALAKDKAPRGAKKFKLINKE
tara:strand:- start:386 stop:598 length:213 start_codon:yes stop_codon:yes gene_type:complete